MSVRTVSAAAAATILAAVALGSPAQAAICGVWPFEKTCPGPGPVAPPAADAASAKPAKPLSLRAVAHKDAKSAKTSKTPKTATRETKPEPEKHATRTASRTRHARTRHAAARHFASAKRRSVVAAVNRSVTARNRQRLAAAREAEESDDDTPAPKAAPTPKVATAPAVAPNPAKPPSTTDGFARSQDEVTALDLAADSPKMVGDDVPARNEAALNPPPAAPATPQAAPAPVAAASAPSALSPPASSQPAPVTAATAPAPAASPVPAVATASTPQPEEDVSWLRRLAIGLGGVLTLASAVRLFAG